MALLDIRHTQIGFNSKFYSSVLHYQLFLMERLHFALIVLMRQAGEKIIWVEHLTSSPPPPPPTLSIEHNHYSLQTFLLLCYCSRGHKNKVKYPWQTKGRSGNPAICQHSLAKVVLIRDQKCAINPRRQIYVSHFRKNWNEKTSAPKHWYLLASCS